jgi:sulfur-oxidizing protein SoxY
MNRRETLRLLSLMTAAGLLPLPHLAHARSSAFDATSLAAAQQGIGASQLKSSKDITLLVPDIAENGDSVPVSISAPALSPAEQIVILADKNPFPLSGIYRPGPNSLAVMSVKIKLRETSRVYALIQSGGVWHVASKEVRVTVGGCGNA